MIEMTSLFQDHIKRENWKGNGINWLLLRYELCFVFLLNKHVGEKIHGYWIIENNILINF